MTSASASIPVGYKQTEIGVFPADWEIKTLGEIGEVTGAGVDKKSNPNEEPVRLVNYVDVYNRRPITSNLLSHWVTAPANKANRCSVRKGDVFFTPTSEVREDIAVSSMALEDIPDAVYSYHLVRLRCNDEVEFAYRANAFTAKYFLDQASVLADGSGTRYVVNLPNFRRMLVALPPRDEQRRIGTLLTDVETQITKLSEEITKKTNMKKGVMQKLLTGKSRLPGFNGEWKTTTLLDIVDSDRAIRYGIVQPGKFDQNGRFMIRGQDYSAAKGWASPSEIFKVSAIVERKYKNARVKTGDLIMTIVGYCGHVEEIPNWLDGGNLTQTTARIAIHPAKANARFCKYALLSDFCQKQVGFFVKGAAQPGLNCGDVEKILINMPNSIREQEAIAEILSDMDAEIAALEDRLEKAKAIKQGMMQQLLTGRIRLVDPGTPVEASA